ncbi:hypothetical protein F5B20DRAFT_548668 [Whalleya microplaca]|nr:hypothetical protein F5B20DRAFT_548668 [Whalleya microplaca]
MSSVSRLIQSPARASLARAASQTRGARPLRRTFTEGRPPPAHGGSNQRVVIGLVAISIPALAWFTMRPVKLQATHVAAPGGLDPAARARLKRETEPEVPVHRHPEHEDPELKAAFGVPHKKKRVDGQPDDRNHKSMSERNRMI